MFWKINFVIFFLFQFRVMQTYLAGLFIISYFGEVLLWFVKFQCTKVLFEKLNLLDKFELWQSGDKLICSYCWRWLEIVMVYLEFTCAVEDAVNCTLKSGNHACYTCMGRDMDNCVTGTVCCNGACFKLVDKSQLLLVSFFKKFTVLCFLYTMLSLHSYQNVVFFFCQWNKRNSVLI